MESTGDKTEGGADSAQKRAKIPRHSNIEFDERAKQNSEKLMKQHDFKHANIEEMELGDKDYFTYNPEEEDIRYAALSFEHLFRFNTTFSAIKWGV